MYVSDADALCVFMRLDVYVCADAACRQAVFTYVSRFLPWCVVPRGAEGTRSSGIAVYILVYVVFNIVSTSCNVKTYNGAPHKSLTHPLDYANVLSSDTASTNTKHNTLLNNITNSIHIYMNRQHVLHTFR